MYQQPAGGIEDRQVANPAFPGVVDLMDRLPTAAAYLWLPLSKPFDPDFWMSRLDPGLKPLHRADRISFPAPKMFDKIFVYNISLGFGQNPDTKGGCCVYLFPIIP